MSILIKGMEMPKTEEESRLLILTPDGVTCLTKLGTGNQRFDTIEVQPHGRLIDADVLLASFKESIDECHKWANEIPNETEMYARVSQSLGTFVECSLRTKGMPTVISADKDGGT